MRKLIIVDAKGKPAPVCLTMKPDQLLRIVRIIQDRPGVWSVWATPERTANG